MKKSIFVRIITVLGGLALLALGVCALAEGFFGAAVMQALGGALAANGFLAVLGKILTVLAILALGVCVVWCALPCPRPKDREYVMIKGEDGPIGVAVKAIEKKVLACVAKHGEIESAEVVVREVRDGIVILLNVDQVSGVSIPMSVGLLQKQVRQYVGECTGIDVAEVRVMVDNRTEAHVESAFVVEDTVMPQANCRTEEFRQERLAPAETPVEQVRQLAENAQQPKAEEAEPAQSETDAAAEIAEELEELDAQIPVPETAEEAFEEEEKPLHQRVFGAEEMPVTVPMPPEMAMEVREEERTEEQESAEPAKEEPAEICEGAEDTEQDPWTAPEMQAAANELLYDSCEDEACGSYESSESDERSDPEMPDWQSEEYDETDEQADLEEEADVEPVVSRE